LTRERKRLPFQKGKIMKNKTLVAKLKRLALELPKAPAEAFDAVPVSCQKCCAVGGGGNGVSQN
jgi:hypothetical protein